MSDRQKAPKNTTEQQMTGMERKSRGKKERDDWGGFRERKGQYDHSE